jgi:hypothetical protein
MATDSIITPQEKTGLKDEWTQIQSDYATIASQASIVAGIGYADLTAAYNALAAYINTATAMFSDMNANTSINRSAFTTVFTNYYTERTKLVTQISQAQIDALNIGGQNYLKNSGYFQDLSGWQLSAENGEGALTLYTGDATHGPLLRVTKTGNTGGWHFGTGMESAGGNICLPQGKFISGIEYTLAFYVYCSSTVVFNVHILNGDGTNNVSGTFPFPANSQWQRVQFTFTANSLSSASSRIYIAVNPDSANKTFVQAFFTKFVLCEGNKAPEWKTSEYDLQYAIQANKDLLTAINENFTQIVGGLILSTFLKLGAQNQSGEWIESAGMKAMYSDASEIAAYFGGTYEQALAGNAPLIIKHNGELTANKVTVRGTIFAETGEFSGELKSPSGKIGGFTIGSDRIGVDASSSGTSGNTGFALYSDFLKFSDSYTWASIGTNVLPLSVAATGVGRFTNEKPTGYGTNYGLLITVKNAMNNMAIKATGDIASDGFVKDYGFTAVTPEANEIYIPHETITKPNMFKILAKFTNSNSGMAFPARSSVASKLAITASDPFAVKMIIICSAASTQLGFIRGRNTDISGMGTTQHAQRLNNDGGVETGKLNMSAGDISEFMLVWDGSNYYAYHLNHRS